MARKRTRVPRVYDSGGWDPSSDGSYTSTISMKGERLADVDLVWVEE